MLVLRPQAGARAGARNHGRIEHLDRFAEQEHGNDHEHDDESELEPFNAVKIQENVFK